jgi:hypothetical protein
LIIVDVAIRFGGRLPRGALLVLDGIRRREGKQSPGFQGFLRRQCVSQPNVRKIRFVFLLLNYWRKGDWSQALIQMAGIKKCRDERFEFHTSGRRACIGNFGRGEQRCRLIWLQAG